MDSDKNQDRDFRLRFGVGLMRTALAETAAKASPQAEVRLAVVVREPDGSGRIGATFEGEEFLSDVEALLGDMNEDG